MGIFNRIYSVSEIVSSAKVVLPSQIGDSLESLIHFGNHLDPSLGSHREDKIQLLILLKEVNAATLDRLANACRSITGFEKQVAPMVMTRAEIESSTDVFPTTFLEIQHHHEVLHGADIFKEISIDAAFLRLRCEQELKNLLLRLQASYLAHHGRSRQLKQLFHRSIKTFVQTLHSVQILFDQPFTQSGDELIENTSKQLGLDQALFEKLLAANTNAERCLDLSHSYCVSLIELVAAAAAGVDNIPDQVELTELMDD